MIIMIKTTIIMCVVVVYGNTLGAGHSIYAPVHLNAF
jgi:hypothetical protein